MAARNSAYWEKRFKTLENSLHREGLECYAEIEEQYRKAERELQKSLRSWYQRFADNNEISLAEAKKWLRGKDLEEFKWTVQDYIKAGEENALDGRWMKQLENASAKYHISRLESLELEMQQSLEIMFGNQLDSLDAAMRKVYQDGYYHTAFEIQKGWGVGWNFAQLDERKISKVIKKPWAADGKDFSERIWENREKLVNELNQTVVQNMMLGQDPQKAINEIAKKMQTSRSNAGRLVMTEEAYFSSVAQEECFKELDVEQYQIVATLDNKTSEICQEMDGKVFPMSEYEAGTTAPPFHPNCRSTTIPYFDEWYGLERERAARDEDGNVYDVPADMTYKEWKKELNSNLKAWTDNAESDTLINIRLDNLVGSVYTAEMARKQSDERKDFKFISDKTFNDLTISARKNGAVIYRGGEDVERHLDYLNAASSNIGNIMFFREKVCISEVLEETYHFQQNLIGLNDDKEGRLRSLLNEIDAKEYLIANASKYKIPRNEIDLTKKQLEAYKKQLQEEGG